MNKRKIIKFLYAVEITIVVAISLGCFSFMILSDDSFAQRIFLGVGIGAIIGGLMDILLVLPKKFKDKDERTLVISLLSQLIAYVMGFILLFICLLLVVFNIINLSNILIFALVSLGMILFILIVEKILNIVVSGSM